MNKKINVKLEVRPFDVPTDVTIVARTEISNLRFIPLSDVPEDILTQMCEELTTSILRARESQVENKNRNFRYGDIPF